MEEVHANSIMCELCSFECVKYKKLRRHYRKEHPECELLSCPFCDLVTSDHKVVSSHKKVEHRQDRIGCSCCDFSTKSWRKWAQHKDTVHQSDVTESVQTNYKDTVHQSDVTESLHTNHKDTVHQSDVTEGITYESYFQITECSYEAHDDSATPARKRCKISLSSNRVDDTAVQSEGEGLSNCRNDMATELVSNSDSGSLFSDHSQQEKSLHDISNHKCATCGKKYTSVRRLSRHQLKHTDTPCAKFYCNLCNTTFTKKSSLTDHQLLHDGSRPFKCQFCDYATSKKSTLDQHLNSHSGTKPYKCNICDYATTFRSNLLYHTVKHSNDRPFACELCTKAFKRRDHLQTHIRARHEFKL